MSFIGSALLAAHPVRFDVTPGQKSATFNLADCVISELFENNLVIISMISLFFITLIMIQNYL